jgi:5-methylcytosine-specific restriction endonuclease McrA
MSTRATLLLNSTYEPLSVISWQKAVSLWFTDKVEIVEDYDDFSLRSMTIEIKCPAVVRLLKYVKFKNRTAKFSRINVFRRDNFTCQFCRDQPGVPNLTFDHVLPRAQGGKTTWSNIVTACLPCNSRKGNRTPASAGMALLSKPVRPSETDRFRFSFSFPKTPDAWRDYLYWNTSLEE